MGETSLVIDEWCLPEWWPYRSQWWNARGVNFKFKNKEDITITIPMIIEILASSVRK